jgi:quercetin dioxygenase-like cupin family protein
MTALAALRNNKGGSVMGVSRRRLARVLGLVALAGALGIGAALAQQPAGQMPPGHMPGQMPPGHMPGQMPPGQMPPSKVTALMKQAIAEFPGHEVTMLTLDIPPGGGSPAHRHPGHHAFGYVLEGAYKIKVGDGPEKVLHKGDAFYEAPGELHAVSSNASDTEPAKVLVVMVVESGKPLTVPEKP